MKINDIWLTYLSDIDYSRLKVNYFSLNGKFLMPVRVNVNPQIIKDPITIIITRLLLKIKDMSPSRADKINKIAYKTMQEFMNLQELLRQEKGFWHYLKEHKSDDFKTATRNFWRDAKIFQIRCTSTRNSAIEILLIISIRKIPDIISERTELDVFYHDLSESSAEQQKLMEDLIIESSTRSKKAKRYNLRRAFKGGLPGQGKKS